EQAPVAVDRQHDHDWVRAREVLDLAGRTLALPAGLRDVGRRAAICAEAMPRMPREQRLRLGERREMLRPDEPLHGNRAQIGDEEIGMSLERLGGFGIERDAEAPGVPCETEKHALGRRRERTRLLGAE